MADEQLHWVRFAADHDHRSYGGESHHTQTVAYKAGMRIRVTAACRDKAVALKRAEAFTPNAATAAALEADPYAADAPNAPPPQPAPAPDKPA